MTKLFLVLTYSLLILLSEPTPKIAFLINLALVLWKVSKSTEATADLILEAIKLHMSPTKSLTLKMASSDSLFPY